MDEAALEAQGVAALWVHRKMLKAFEVVHKKMGIDDPTAPPPPGTPAPAPPVSSPAVGLGLGTGSATGGGVGSLITRRLEQSSRFPQTSEMSIKK
jgi:hypothetical protein